VLLIIFMVTASYIVNPAIKVDLPKAASGEDTGQQSTLALGLDKQGRLFLNASPTTPEEVKKFIVATLPKTPDLQAVIGADKAVPHGEVVRLIDLVRAAGVKRFAITVEREGK
jgi:biopolymer transport protein ExbD